MVTASSPAAEPATGQPLVLVIDDEPTMRDTISYRLQREGWRTATAEDGPSGIEAARRLNPDLIILDVMLPGFDGLQVCRAIRAESTVPILFLSAKGEDVDRILGLEIGGDDYLTKPFVMRELVARVRANLRRADMRRAVTAAPERLVPPLPRAPHTDEAETIEAGTLRLNRANRTLFVRGQPVNLKPKEFDLLAYLMAHPGRVISREAMLREVWNYAYTFDTRTVDVHVRGLRQKIEDDPSRPRLIETVRGFGYRFQPGE